MGDYNADKTVWITRWALTHGIFEIEAEPNDGWVSFTHPWTGRSAGAGPGDWHKDRWGALRQAETKRKNEIRILVDRLKAMNNRKIQEYDLRDLNNPAKPLRDPPEEILSVKRGMYRKGMERIWGDADLQKKSHSASDLGND